MESTEILDFTEEMDEEIAALKQSPYVKLAQKEISVRNNIRYQKRKYLYNLRCLEKRGKKLAEEGISIETLADVIAGYGLSADED